MGQAMPRQQFSPGTRAQPAAAAAHPVQRPRCLRPQHRGGVSGGRRLHRGVRVRGRLRGQRLRPHRGRHAGGPGGSGRAAGHPGVCSTLRAHLLAGSFPWATRDRTGSRSRGVGRPLLRALLLLLRGRLRRRWARAAAVVLADVLSSHSPSLRCCLNARTFVRPLPLLPRVCVPVLAFLWPQESALAVSDASSTDAAAQQASTLASLSSQPDQLSPASAAGVVSVARQVGRVSAGCSVRPCLRGATLLRGGALVLACRTVS